MAEKDYQKLEPKDFEEQVKLIQNAQALSLWWLATSTNLLFIATSKSGLLSALRDNFRELRKEENVTGAETG